MQIRKATLADAAVVRAIIHEVYVGGGWADPQRSPEYVRSLLDAESRISQADVLIAELDGEAVATITATQFPPLANVAAPGELEVRMLGVRDGARRRGVARALMQACEDMARERHLSHMVLSTEAAMVGAQRLYESLGYLRTPERDWEIAGFPLITYGKQISR